jgi:hypothetical protein
MMRATAIKKSAMVNVLTPERSRTMKTASLYRTLAGAALLALSGSIHALGEANGTWLKVKFATENGYEINHVTGAVAKKDIKPVVCYVYLNYDTSGAPTYKGTTYCPTEAGTYTDKGSAFDLVELPGGNTAFSSDDYIGFANASGQFAYGIANATLTIKKDGGGKFKSASLKILGAQINSAIATPGGGNMELIGGITASGKTVSADKVPSIPM